MIYFNKYFKIPGPKDLGMSDNNYAMGMRLMFETEGQATWEDYYERVAKEYPVKYFFAASLPGFLRKCWMRVSRPITDSIYYLKCHLLPSHRFHLVDIRQPDYRYGWMDTDWRLTYAMFNLLVEFVEKEVPKGYYVPSDEEVAKDVDTDDGTFNQYAGMKNQRARYDEFIAIYNFWKKEYQKNEDKSAELLHTWAEAKRAKLPEVQKLWEERNAFDAFKDKRLDEMLHRLIDVRKSLWT